MSSTDLFKDAKDVFKHVCKTYKKTEDEVNGDVETLKKWIQTQRHLPEIMRESHIRNLLILSKFSIEKAKQKIDMYYTIRSLLPDFFDDCNPKSPRMRDVYKQGTFGLHPNLVQGLYRVHFAKLEPSRTEILPREALLTLCNCSEIRLHEDCFFYDVFVVDSATVTFSDIMKVTPDIVMKALTIYEKLFSHFLKATYVINAPSFMYKLMALLKTVLKPKIFERIHVSEDDRILKKVFTIDDLPKDYGGYGPSLQELNDVMKKKFEEYQGRFDELDKMRVDERLRPEKLVNDEILGFYGNFKKLSVD